MKESLKDYRPDIDGLRAVAVLMVVLFHALGAALPGGFAGVDIFFVISGFLITGIILKDLDAGRFSLWNFYARRCRRILPALLVTLAASWAIAGLALRLDEFRNFGKHLLAGALFGSNFLLNAEAGYFDVAADLKPLRHLWSLAVEEQFYLLWPLTLWLFLRPKLNARALTLLLLLASFAFNLARVHRFPDETFYLLPGRFWELLLGCLLAQLYHGDWFSGAGPLQRLLASVKDNAGLSFLLSALPAVLLAVFLLRFHAAPFPGAAALLPTLAAALFIYNGPDSRLNRLLSARPFVYIGKISYPLYLWHWPLFSFAYIKWGRFLVPELGLLIAGVSVLLAALTWRFVELYAQHSLFKSLPQERRDRVWVASGLSALLAAGLAGYGIHRGTLVYGAQRLDLVLSRYKDYKPHESKTTFFLGDPRQSAKDFPAGCLDGLGKGRDAVFIWGDSYGERFSYGLANLLAPRGVPVYQMGGSACPPIAGVSVADRPNCPGINDKVLALLGEHRPAVVLLAANWGKHIYYPGNLQKLDRTVKLLRKMGVKKVLIAGQLPVWREPVYRLLMNYSGGRLPERTFAGLGDIFSADAEMKKAAAGSGAEYVSVIPRLCSRSGCLTMVGGDLSRDLSTFDDGHLTDSASDYVAQDPLGPAVLKALSRNTRP